MTVTSDSFRDAFLTFTDEDKYSDEQIDFWITFATLMMDPQVWGAALDMGIMLYVAHNLALDWIAQSGPTPGIFSGVAQSKSVGPVSISYNTNIGFAGEEAGHWNLTLWGIRLYRLMRIFGAGPVQIGISAGPPFSGGSAWYGPWPFPAPSGTGFSS